MTHGLIFAMALGLSGAVSSLQAQSGSTNTPPAQVPAQEAEAIRDHIDAADDLVDSLLEWRHVVTWRGDGDTPPPKGPANTLISIDKSQAQRLIKLLGTLEAQLPEHKSGHADKPDLRGDLRAHVQKAQSIARTELQAPHARETADGRLLTIDRTALRRLDVELDAMAALTPREIS
jgi:hypothetical protein